MTARPRIWLIADDYGIAPAVDEAIRALIADGRLTGTGCMTLFPEWPEAAARLRAEGLDSRAEIGLHLTLTDFDPLSGAQAFGAAVLPRLPVLMRACLTGRADEAAIHGELDAQLAAFRCEMGRAPAYIDGHQHVHFLAPVRRWLLARRVALADVDGALPWLRGGPQRLTGDGWRIKAKAMVVSLLARGFDRQMAKAGFPLRGPLAGFYDWTAPKAFLPYMERLAGAVGPRPLLVMCHPGGIDATLEARDQLVAARVAEWNALRDFGGWQVIAGSGA